MVRRRDRDQTATGWEADPTRPLQVPRASGAAAQHVVGRDDRVARSADRLLHWAVGASALAVIGAGLSLAGVTLTHSLLGRGQVSLRSARAELAALVTLVAESGPARRALVSAVDDVRACSMDPESATQIARTAVVARQGVLAGLGSLELSAVPEGSRLRNEITAAMTESMAADDAYARWMGDLAALGTCRDPRAEPAYSQAVALSLSATATKIRLAEDWNAVSAPYGLTRLSPEEL